MRAISFTSVAAGPATIYLSGVVRDFQRSHADFDVMPIGGPGHYAGNIALRAGPDRKPVFVGDGFRVNDQWRIAFQWSDRHAHEVQLIDYHRG